ncbi:MAG: Do family serine endopeptidase [Bacteroidota bacterium]
MRTKKVFLVFAVAVLSALVTVFAYSHFVKPEKEIVEVPQETVPEARYTSLSSAPQGESPNLTEAAEKSIHAVVHVKTVASQAGGSSGNPLYDFFFGPGQQRPRREEPIVGAGSGVIISEDGYIVTNNHVIERTNNIEVTLNDNRTFDAVLVGHDEATDLALLKIEASDLPYMQYGNSDELKIGEWVLAVGNPFNLTSTVTAGIVSAKSRNINIMARRSGSMGIESFIQTDAAVNAGNSGGALVNQQGELVGLNTAIASRTGSYSGYSFAIPVSIVKKVTSDLMEYGEVQRGILGVNIRNVNSDLAEELNLKQPRGVYVANTMEDGGAEAAGMEEGDVIISVNGEKTDQVSELQEKISNFRPGDEVTVTALRDGKKKQFSVTLRNIYGSTDVVKQKKAFETLGASFEEVSNEDKARLKIRNGIQVTDIQDGKLREAGIQEGYIITKANRVSIDSTDDLRKVIENLEDGLFLTGVYPNGQVAYYAINLEN